MHDFNVIAVRQLRIDRLQQFLQWLGVVHLHFRGLLNPLRATSNTAICMKPFDLKIRLRLVLVTV